MLKPYNTITELICSNSFTNSLIIPFIDQQLSKECNVVDSSALKFYCCLQQNLKILSKEYSDVEDVLGLSTLLDPRFKDYNFHQNIKSKVESLLNEKLNSLGVSSDDRMIVDENYNHNLIEYEDLFGNVVHEEKVSQIDKLINDEKLDISKDACKWWYSNRVKYPDLFKIVKEISNIPASSSESERTFSKAGYLINARRSLLSSSMANISLFMSNVYK